MSGVRKHKGAVVYSVALHVVLVAALSLSVHLPSWQRYTTAPAPIQGVMIDQRVIEKRDQIVREEQQRQQREVKQRREAEEKVQREHDETESNAAQLWSTVYLAQPQ